MLDWFRLSPSPRSRSAGGCLSGQGGHPRGPLFALVARDGGHGRAHMHTWERRRAALQEEEEPHGQGARRRGWGLVEYFVPTGLHPCSNFLRLNQASALPVCTQSHPGRPRAQRGWVQDVHDVPPWDRECIKGIRERRSAAQRQGHDGNATPVPMTRRNATTGDRTDPRRGGRGCETGWR